MSKVVSRFSNGVGLVFHSSWDFCFDVFSQSPSHFPLEGIHFTVFVAVIGFSSSTGSSTFVALSPFLVIRSQHLVVSPLVFESRSCRVVPSQRSPRTFLELTECQQWFGHVRDTNVGRRSRLHSLHVRTQSFSALHARSVFRMRF